MTLLTGEQFDRTRRLALRVAGIELFERHRRVLARRSSRLGIEDATRFEALLDAVEAGESEAQQRLVRIVTTKHTAFFRHSEHFDLAAEAALAAVRRTGSARLWSAGAATGEEAYSLAVALLDVFANDDPPVEILATDIDADALGIAREGVYDESALDVLGADRQRRHFAESAGETRRRASLSLRRSVRFELVNLAGDDWPVNGPFDVVMCRNVLMYLADDRRRVARDRLVAALAPTGLLILDPAEHLGQSAHPFVQRADGVYALKPSASAPRELP